MDKTFCIERFSLARKRLEEIENENVLKKKEHDFFKCQASFLLYICKIYDRLIEIDVSSIEIEELQAWNIFIFQDILPQNYSTSYSNPTYSVEIFGPKMGQVFSVLASEMRSAIPVAYEKNVFELLIRIELLLEMYSACIDKADYTILKDIIYYYVFDYSDECSKHRISEMVDYNNTFATDIVMKSNLSSTDYLYFYGEYITDNELKLSKYIASLSEDIIDKIANVFTEGYRIGFEVTGKDLSKKKTVNIRFPLGMERIIKKAIFNFEKMGLKPVIYRAGNSLFRRQGMNKVGYSGANPNRQYDFDHKEDEALYLDGNLVTRKLECIRQAFEEYKDIAYGHAGPAVMETFGENITPNITKDEALSMNEKQQKLAVKFSQSSAMITNEYIKGEERSFTIIAFPVPAIGKDFEKIFDETIRINTLDYKKYQEIQQNIIDVLDKATSVHICGMNGNKTDLVVNLCTLSDSSTETKFENCVADVNIPVGEVFTSPCLKGTNGILHVKDVFLNELEYKDIYLNIQDGMIREYSCKNYDDAEKNLKYIKDNLLFHHETLPMGEFAIGTNTTAYVVAKTFKIESKLPILIGEKTGPHFAFGDTCYSHEEDLVTYNPDGKKIVARENEISMKRKSNPEEAYFNCHTDITIPYDELGSIDAIMEDGSKERIIEKGRFVLEKTQELNKAFLKMNEFLE